MLHFTLFSVIPESCFFSHLALWSITGGIARSRFLVKVLPHNSLFNYRGRIKDSNWISECFDETWSLRQLFQHRTKRPISSLAWSVLREWKVTCPPPPPPPPYYASLMWPLRQKRKEVHHEGTSSQKFCLKKVWDVVANMPSWRGASQIVKF